VVNRCLTNCAVSEDCASDHFCDTTSGQCVSRALDVSAGADHTCAILQDGTVWCWGRNQDLECGADTGGDPIIKPRELRHLKGRLSSIHAGYGFTCGVTTDGKLVCWGTGPLGAGEAWESKRSDSKPVLSVSRVELTGVRAACAGYNHACALRDDGVWCWGGAQGVGNSDGSALATPSLSQNGVDAIHCGVGKTVAMQTGSGDVFGWGYTSFAASDLKLKTTRDPSIRSISLGDGRDCWRTANNSIHCPEEVFKSVEAFAVAKGRVCAALSSGAISCASAAESPVEIGKLSGVTRVVGHGYGRHHCALTTQGRILCWGGLQLRRSNWRRHKWRAL
jgi:alpha-tubulin suppressor-like RCC1 family protein